MGEDEGELIIEEDPNPGDNDEDNIVINQDDVDTSAQMEYDDVTDSPAVQTPADSPKSVTADSPKSVTADHLANNLNDNQLMSDVMNSHGDDDTTKQDDTIPDCYPKKVNAINIFDSEMVWWMQWMIIKVYKFVMCVD